MPLVFRKARGRRRLSLRLSPWKSLIRGAALCSCPSPVVFHLRGSFLPNVSIPGFRNQPFVSPDTRTGLGITIDASTSNPLQQVGDLTDAARRSPSAIHPTYIPFWVRLIPPSRHRTPSSPLHSARLSSSPAVNRARPSPGIPPGSS